jgi:glycosyltransferase involved in cell wall biosynthesis
MMRLSVVIAAHNAQSTITRCLTALIEQAQIDQAEIIVASSSTDDTNNLIRSQFPTVLLLELPATLTVPELRGRGIAASHGQIIAVLDPFSIAQPGWMSALFEAHSRQSTFVIGGPVGLADAHSQSWTAWVIYINEYGMFLPPMQEGPMDILAGSNVSYKREALFDADQARYPIFWKTFVNWELVQQGHTLWLEPNAIVLLDKPLQFADYLITRYYHGRCFAGMRHESLAVRLVRALATPLLPFVLLWRWSTRYWSRGRHREKLILTLPAQLLLFSNWSLGEMVGSLFGVGRSCTRLFY